MSNLTIGLIITLILIIIIGAFLFHQKLETLKIDHSYELGLALSNQKFQLKESYGHIITNIEIVNSRKIEDLETDFLKKIRMLGNEKDNILTNYENKIPIMSFPLEPASNVRFRTPMPEMIKKEEKLYHNEGMIFSYSDHNELSHGKVYELLRTEVAKWLIDNQMVFGIYNVNSRQVEFRLRYLQFPA